MLDADLADLKQIPLLAVATSLTALEAHDKKIEVGWTGPKGLDQAGYESDGGEDPTKNSSVLPPTPDTKTYEWKFSKSPLGEFVCVDVADLRLWRVLAPGEGVRQVQTCG